MAEPEKVQRTLLLSMGSSIKDGRWQSGEEWLGCYGWAFDPRVAMVGSLPSWVLMVGPLPTWVSMGRYLPTWVAVVKPLLPG